MSDRCLTVCLALLSPGWALAATMALVGGTLIDGTGAAPLNHSVVLVRDERIVAVGREDEIRIPADAAIVSTRGLTVIPGLIDLAVELNRLGHANPVRWREAYEPLTDKVVLPMAARALLSAGVTTARDVTTPPERIHALRHRINDGRLPGPTVIAAGAHIARENRDRASVLVARTATELRQAVEKLAAAGAEAVILEDVAEYSPSELSTLHFAAEDAGLRWHAWVRSDADIAPAARAGAFSLIGIGTDFRDTLPTDALLALAERAATGRPLYWSVGASTLTNYEWLRSNQSVLDDPRWQAAFPRVVAEDLRLSLKDLDAHPIDLETPHLRRSVLASRLRSAKAAGAHLLLGSLAGEPGHIPSRASWQEAAALVTEAGYTTAEALRAATLDAAFTLGLDADVGSVVPGKYADLVAVRGDVLRSIDHLADVRMVFRRGQRYAPTSVDDEEQP